MSKQTKVYLAGKVGGNEVDNVIDLLGDNGYDLIFDWRADSRPKKPYLDHSFLNHAAAADMLEAATEADVFVLSVEGGLYGAMVEFGAALGAYMERGRSVAARPANFFVILPTGERQSIFFTLPCVNVVTLDEFKSIVGRQGLVQYGRMA